MHRVFNCAWFTVPGCSRTHSAVTLGDWSDPLDPDVETQTIYKQFLQGRDKLRSVLYSISSVRALQLESHIMSPLAAPKKANFGEMRVDSSITVEITLAKALTPQPQWHLLISTFLCVMRYTTQNTLKSES